MKKNKKTILYHMVAEHFIKQTMNKGENVGISSV